MRQVKEIYQALEGRERINLAVAGAADREVLKAVVKAHQKGIASGILFGDQKKISALLAELGEELSAFKIVHTQSQEESAQRAVHCVSGGGADVLMKGMLPSAVFIRAVLDKEHGLRKGRILNSAAIVEICNEGRNRLLVITDPGFIPLPDLDAKKEMIQNLLPALHRLGFPCPKVAVLSAAETVNPKMVSSTDGRALQEMNEQGELTGCVVAGPLSLDLAVSAEAAEHKGFHGPVAGDADVLLVPSVETGNALLKAFTCFMDVPVCGLVCGASAPIVFTSRADSAQTKQNTIALAALLAGGMKDE